MADTTFVPGTVITSEWLNDINDKTYSLFSSVPPYLENRKRHWVSPLDAPYNAKFDGVTDDGAAINACFADPAVKSVRFPEGTALTSVQINNQGKPFEGAGVEKTTIKATAAMQSVFLVSGQRGHHGRLYVHGNGFADEGFRFTTSNGTLLELYRITDTKRDGIYFPTTGNNSGTTLRKGLIQSVGNTYSTGTATVSAGSDTVTITGASNLTTLGFVVNRDFLKVGTEVAREIVAIGTNTVQVYPAFDSAHTAVTYSLRSGSGVHIDANSDNSRIHIEDLTTQNCAVAGIDDKALYGALCYGNIHEFNEWGFLVNRRTGGGVTIGHAHRDWYGEGFGSGDYLIGSVNGLDIENKNAAASTGIFQSQFGSGVRVKQGNLDLNEKVTHLTSVATYTMAFGECVYLDNSVNVTLTLPTVDAATARGIGGNLRHNVTIISKDVGARTLTIKADPALTVNGVIGSTGITVSGSYKVRQAEYAHGTGWVVDPA